MPRYASNLVERIEIAEGTFACAFARPAGFQFIAGQNVTLTLPDPIYTDAKGNTRTLTIASPPGETEQLWVATRQTGSAFKRSLAEMESGSPVSIFGPAGVFCLDPAAVDPVLFVAGGIGITPFRSMVLDAVRQRLARPITLVYSNRNPEGAAYHAELSALAATDPYLRYVPIMTQAESSRQPWLGERRPVDATLLRELITNLAAAVVYVAGPPGLVAAVAAGADPRRVLAEEFSGYQSRLPEQQVKTAPLADYVAAARVGDIRPGGLLGVNVRGTQVVLCHVGEHYYALSDECPHAGGVLSEGELSGTRIICPLHGASFDITNGTVADPPADEPLRCYPVRVVGETIEIQV